ncbi:MAG: glycosyltransferase family 39 protein [Anaerolineae bacterium]|nr:glycosyltransferase family 39 protein [Anaerolineae bacterium]
MSKIPGNTKYKIHLTLYLPLLLILFIFTMLTLYNSILLPLGEAADETDHVQYLRFVARTGHPPLSEIERDEAGYKGGLAPLYYWLTAWPIALVGEDTPPDIRRVDARPERHIPTDGLGINHVLHTLDEQWPWRGQILAWHLIRFLSLPMAWLTIIATYALTRRLLPEQKVIAVGAAAFVAFLPRFVISSAVINDDNLVFALVALLLLVQVIILQGDRRPATFALLGALFGLSLVAKYFSLILIPEIIFTLFIFLTGSRVASSKVAGSRVAGETQRSVPFSSLLSLLFSLSSKLLPFLIALLLTAGPWFVFILLRFNRINDLGLLPGLAASLGEPQITEGLVGLFSGQSVRPPAATYSLLEWLGLLYRSFWFEYGWMQIFTPPWVYILYTLFLLLALIGLTRKIKIYQKSNQGSKSGPKLPALRTAFYILHSRPIAVLLCLHLFLFIIVLLARYVLSATIDTGQGRHLYPALPVIACLVALGLAHLRLRKQSAASSNGFSFSSLTSPFSLLLTVYGLLCVFILQPSFFILPHYLPLPITITPPAELPITYRQAAQLPAGFSLAGFDVAPTASAGHTLPVTLYWTVEKEVNQDFLVSLCLQDDGGRPAACWRGHFVNGRYPARAWETGDTLADTIFIPIPACHHLNAKTYQLHLKVWPLALNSPTPVLAESPSLAQTFTEPHLVIQATDSFTDLLQTVELWRNNQRLTTPVSLKMNEAIAYIAYAAYNNNPVPTFEHTLQNPPWRPVPQLNTPLYLPCADGPTPYAHLAHFIAAPTLPNGTYQAVSDTFLPSLTLSLRDRVLAPLTSTLTFSHTLAPLSLQLSDQPSLDLGQISTSAPPPTPYSLLPSASPLPLTVRWQAHRWMADPLIISLKLLDKDFMVGGERVTVLGDRYPNVLWTPTEIVEETYSLQLEPDTPPGLYQLELSLLRQDKNLPDGFEYLPIINDQETLALQDTLRHNLYPLTLRLLDPAHDSPPPYPLSAQLGESIQLTGYDLLPKSEIVNLKSKIELALYWQNTDPIPADYTIFTQLLGPDGQVWAQWDNPPQAGRYPTTAWLKNDTVVDRYTLTLREGAPPGEYRLLVGMYDPAAGHRLPVTLAGQPQPDHAVQITTLLLTP